MKARLSILFFLQFAVWGSYLVSVGQYLGSAGLGADIQWFYAAGGFAALFMPALMGAVADRYIQAQRLLGLLHLGAALSMAAAWCYGLAHPQPAFGPLFALFALSTAFYIPTVALCNSVSFSALKGEGMNPVKAFPVIRVWGTVGFVVMMWTVNSVWVTPDGRGWGVTLSESDPHAMMRMQYTVWQLFAAACTGLLTALYTLSLPHVPVTAGEPRRGIPVVSSMRLLANRRMLPFFLFAMLIGVALQINNGYVTPWLTHFRGLAEYAGTFGASNATLLTSLSQISEALWILPVGCVLARIGVKRTIMVSIVCWVVNFLCFAFGDTGSGLWLIVTGMLVYGVAFNFFNVAGALYVDMIAPASDKSAAQGLLMMMTKGVGASAGMLGAGAVVNTLCHWEVVGGNRYFMGDWTTAWAIFAAYCALVALLFLLFFRPASKIL